MANEEAQKDKIDITEENDGSAVVELSGDLQMSDESGENAGQRAADEEVHDEDSRGDDGDGQDTEALREARRNRRRAKKELIRRTNQEKDVRLQQLQRENEEFRRRLQNLERNTQSEQIVRIDKGIEDAEVRLEYAKMKLAEATSNNDGQAMVEAQTLWQQANDDVRTLKATRHQADIELRRRQQPEDVVIPDAKIQRLAAQWMQKNSWYNPQGNDADSRVAKKIDELMVTQGWDPKDQDYWDELTDRLQRELPHRYNDRNDSDSREVRRPRNVVGSSGRETSEAYGGVSRNRFVLSPDRVKAMKEAGAWDNPERKARMIKQFMTYDRSNGNRN